VKFDKQPIIDLSKPDIFFHEWSALKGKKCVMVCHDQKIDRRIIQQCEALKKLKIHSLIICLSFDNADKLEKINDLYIHRIGLKKIVPECNVYWFYNYLEYIISHKIKHIRMKNKLRAINNKLYKALLLLKYRSPSINNPLPFDYCYAHTLKKYKADILVAHDLPALKSTVEYAATQKAVTIYDAHEYYWEQKVFSSPQKAIMKKTEDFYIHYCNQIISVNQTFVDLFNQRAGVKKAQVILNCHKYHQISRSKSLHSMINKSEKEKVILFQGAALENRNIENLIKGFLLLEAKNINLVFLGPHDEKYQNKLVQKHKKHIDKTIFFLKSVSPENLLDITASADIGIIPYKPYDFNTLYCTPNKFFEFIQAEIPILYNSQLLELNTLEKQIPGRAYAEDLSSAKKIKKALEKVLLKKHQVDYKQSKNIYCWENEEKKYIKIIQTLLE
jgi:glycosyl transferase family 1